MDDGLGRRPDDAPDFADPEAPRDAEPDYSQYRDQDLASAAHSYADPDALRQDILPDEYQQRTFGSRFRDNFRANQAALAASEHSPQNSPPPGDLGARERAGDKYDAARKNYADKWAYRFEDMDRKRAAAQAAAKDKSNSWFARHKKGAIGGLIGLVLAGGMSVAMLPAIAIGQFGQVANFLQNTTQTVHDLAVGARSLRNTLVSAKVAAKAAVKGAIQDRFQMSRAGMFGAMVGQNYLSQLESAGFKVKTDLTGRFAGIDVDINKLMGTTNYKMLDVDGSAFSTPELKARAEAQNATTRARFEADIQSKYPSLAGQVELSADGKTLSTRTGFKPNYRQALDLTGVAGDVAGANKTLLGKAIKIRYTVRMLGIYSWMHPFEKLKGLAMDKVRDWYNSKKAEQSGKADNTAEKTNPGDDADSKSKASAETGNSELSDIENTAKGKETPKVSKGANIKNIAKGGLGAVFLIGLCAINSATENFLANMLSLTTALSGRYQQLVSQWGQIQASLSGGDDGSVSWDLLGVLSGDLYEDKIPYENYEVDENGNTITNADTKYMSKSWTESAAYEALENGKTVSTDRVPEQVKNMYQEHGGWAAQVGAFLDAIPGLGQIIGFTADVVCSTVGGWIMDILGSLSPLGIIMTALMHTDTVSDKIGALISWAFQIGTGISIDFDILDPDQNMDAAWAGGRYVANSSFATMGAGTVSLADAYQNQLVAQEYLNREWSQRTLADRLFDATDYRSAVAKLANGAGINPMPDSPTQYFANFAKMVAAVPNFLMTGLFGGRSAQAAAATAVDYDIPGAPHIEFTPDFLDKISGSDESYDYDVNADKVYTMLDASGSDKRDYAQKCLGLTIGPGPDYAVSAYEAASQDPKQALLVGLSGTWNFNGSSCSDLAKRDDYQRVALYAGLDYQTLAGYAWYSAPENDPTAQQIYSEIFAAPASPTSSASSSLTWSDPVDNFSSYSITCAFDNPCGANGQTHAGTDYGVPSGTSLKAIGNGTVAQTGVGSGSGGYVMIKYSGVSVNSPKCAGTCDVYVTYEHMQRRDVAVGDSVTSGQVLGLSGGGSNDPDRGTSTGAHLHISVAINSATMGSAGAGNHPDNIDPALLWQTDSGGT